LSGGSHFLGFSESILVSVDGGETGFLSRFKFSASDLAVIIHVKFEQAEGAHAWAAGGRPFLGVGRGQAEAEADRSQSGDENGTMRHGVTPE
jgi:hypothetical protein